MPNRYIREDAIESEAVNSLSWHGEVFYRRLLNRVDDFGCYPATISLLRAMIFPLQLDRVRDADVSRLLAECEKAGLLFVYAVAQKQFLVINKWEKGRAKIRKYPEPPVNIREQMHAFVYGCSQPHANVPDSDTDSDTDSDKADGGSEITVIPLFLSTDEFRKAWAAWIEHRKEKRSPLKPGSQAEKQALKKLEAWGDKRAIAAIYHSISNNWLGIFEPDGKTSNANDRTGSNSRHFTGQPSYEGITDK